MASEESKVIRYRSILAVSVVAVALAPSIWCWQGATPSKTTDKSGSVLDEAAYEQHAAELRKKYSESGFSVIVERPFVVLGDEPEATVRERTVRTIRWAVTKLKQDYFHKDPTHILDVWLFKDAVSYRKSLKEYFNEEPGTPFGYYSSRHKCLFMNIATGGGTLVHEIVHPYIEANFPGCPSWFNEGLASLYEQSGEENGHIRGYTNWRLPGLQKAFRAKTAPALKTVLGMSTSQFYQEDRGTNYAQARYLCYYLQEQGLLVKFYREFVAGHKNDPTGLRTLEQLLGKELDAFEPGWQEFVLKLRFDE